MAVSTSAFLVVLNRYDDLLQNRIEQCEAQINGQIDRFDDIGAGQIEDQVSCARHARTCIASNFSALEFTR